MNTEDNREERGDTFTESLGPAMYFVLRAEYRKRLKNMEMCLEMWSIKQIKADWKEVIVSTFHQHSMKAFSLFFSYFQIKIIWLFCLK